MISFRDPAARLPNSLRRYIVVFSVVAAACLVMLAVLSRNMDSLPADASWTNLLTHSRVSLTYKKPPPPHAQEHDKALERLTNIPSFPENHPNSGLNYKWITEAKLRNLTSCMSRRDCHPNAHKVVIVSGWHCHWALHTGYHGGEGVWCIGIIRALERQGYTVLEAGDNDWHYIYHLHRQLGDMVKVVFSDGGESGHKGTWDEYRKTDDRLDGIPAWKWFRGSYFPTGDTGVVGRAWIISAEPSGWPAPLEFKQDDRHRNIQWLHTGHEQFHMKVAPNEADFTYIGYALKPLPQDTTIIPWSQRPNRVYLLAKTAKYFLNHEHMYEFDYFVRAHKELSAEFPGFEFVGGWQDDRSEDEKKKEGPVPDVIKNFGIMEPAKFDEEYGKSKVLLGIGAPNQSPSPYRALAHAVPFINPHTVDDKGKRKHIQHEGLENIPEPYVYQVIGFNYTSFVDGIRKALKTEIAPMRMERMREEVVDGRLAAWIEADWRTEAEWILRERKAGNETQRTINAKEFEM